MGNVTLEEGSSVWFGAVIRSEGTPITVGRGSNIQDLCVLHVDDIPLIVGENCTIGHGAILHSCTVGDNSLVGMGAIVLNGAKIGKNCLVAAGALIKAGMEVPDGSMVMGMPAKVVRALTEEEIENNRCSALFYMTEGKEYREHFS